MPIFEQGYQHWNGKLASQAWRWWAITRHGVLMQFRSKLTRAVLVLSIGPAMALMLFMILWSLFEQGNTYIKPIMAAFQLPQEILDAPQEYRVTMWRLAFHFFFWAEQLNLVLLVLLVGPGLVSKDLRFNALPLYLSRPIRRWEYFLGKLGVIAFFIMLVTACPAILAWILGILFSLKLNIIVDVLPVLLGSLLISLLISVSYGMVMLGLSSLSRNSRYVAMMWFGFILITWIMSSILYQATNFAEWTSAVSFVKNNVRMQEAILGTDAAWQRVDEVYALVLKQTEKLPIPPSMDRIRQTRTKNDLKVDDPRVFLDHKNTRDGVVIRSSTLRSLYPWWWSALTLLGLGVLSLCILLYRVKSLDRLR